MVRLGVVRFHRTCSFHQTCRPAVCPALCRVPCRGSCTFALLLACLLLSQRSFGLPPSSAECLGAWRVCRARLPTACSCALPRNCLFPVPAVCPVAAALHLRARRLRFALSPAFGKSSLGLPASSAACLGASRVCAVTSAPADCLRLCTGVCAVASAPADCLGSCALPRNCYPVSPLALSLAGTGVAPR